LSSAKDRLAQKTSGFEGTKWASAGELALYKQPEYQQTFSTLANANLQ
jgi:hypothetical protein